VIGFNFKTKRDTAVGFALSGLGAGLFAVAPLMQLAAEHYGTTGFFIIQAAISLNIVVFGTTYFLSKLELHTQEMRSFNNASLSANAITRFRKAIKPYNKALNNKPIYLLCLGMLLNGVGIYLIYLYFPIYIVYKGFSKAQASYMLSIIGICAVIGRLLTGFVASLHKSIDI
jgi:predicted MFS family arabinose efflux permease